MDLSLEQRTGDGRFDGEAFLGVLLIFLRGGGGEEELQGTTAEAFSQDDASSKQPFYVIYYILRSGSFAAACARQSRTWAPILDALGRHVRCSSFDNLMTSSTHQRQ
jgi:hypothetical protein